VSIDGVTTWFIGVHAAPPSPNFFSFLLLGTTREGKLNIKIYTYDPPAGFILNP